MARRVKSAVVVSKPLGGHIVLLPGDVVPADVADLITNPAVFEDVTSSSTAGVVKAPSTQETKTKDANSSEAEAEKAAAEKAEAEKAAADAAGKDDGDDDDVTLPEPPPRSGKGSGKGPWSEYADRIGVEYPEGSDAKAIIALVDDAVTE